MPTSGAVRWRWVPRCLRESALQKLGRSANSCRVSGTRLLTLSPDPAFGIAHLALRGYLLRLDADSQIYTRSAEVYTSIRIHTTLHNLNTMTVAAQTSWEKLGAAKRAELTAALPRDLMIAALPGDSVRNVTDVPKTCGLLSARELDITEASVSGLLADIAAAKYSAVEVTTAFIKRAVIAQQLVSTEGGLVDHVGEPSDRDVL